MEHFKMKTFFIIVTILHACIHFLGFASAFNLLKNAGIEARINPAFGILWLVTGLLFLIGITAYGFNSRLYTWFLLSAVLLSQYLIILSWSDAKYGTLINLIIMIVLLLGNAKSSFNAMVEQEVAILNRDIPKSTARIIDTSAISELPFPVARWLVQSGALGKPVTEQVWLKQSGRMRTKPGGDWMPFTAQQQYSIPTTSFVWSVNVSVFPGIALLGRDKLVEDEGTMLIKLMGLFTVAKDGPNPQASSGTMIRYLAETCWFPAAALSNHISWRTIDSSSAEATLRINDSEVSGVFEFSEEGDFKAFRTDRFYGAGDDAVMEKWLVKAVETKSMNGFRIPVKAEVIWQLDSADFKWLELEITAIRYDSATTKPQ
jgi:hypothetical protein